MNIQIPDLINSLFELGASLAIANNCYRVYQDKMVKGVSPWSTLFFTAWGIYNVWFYPSLHQVLSFIAGIAVCGMNVIWLALMLKYRKIVPTPIDPA